MATQMQLEVILEGKSHSHPCLVKQRQLTSQSRRKRKAEIVSVSVLSCPQIWNIQLEKDREKEKVGGEKFSCWKNSMKIL